MEPNELKIGNYIYQNLTEENEIIQIIKGFEIDSADDPIRKYSPIPFTEEWLLKFGFEFDIFYQKHTNGKICIYWVNGIHLISWCKSHREDILKYNYPKYVHQLQNLYFALTGQELTIK